MRPSKNTCLRKHLIFHSANIPICYFPFICKFFEKPLQKLNFQQGFEWHGMCAENIMWSGTKATRQWTRLILSGNCSCCVQVRDHQNANWISRNDKIFLWFYFALALVHSIYSNSLPVAQLQRVVHKRHIDYDVAHQSEADCDYPLCPDSIFHFSIWWCNFCQTTTMLKIF